MSDRTVRIPNSHGPDSQPDGYGVPAAVVDDALDWYQTLGEDARERGEAMQDMTENWHVVICFFENKKTEIGFGKLGSDDSLEGLVFTTLERVQSMRD